jgi:transcription termination factor NusB
VYIIEKYSPRFSIEKMNTENIIPIYISLAEIFYLDEEIPIIVSINEAVDLAKKF